MYTRIYRGEQPKKHVDKELCDNAKAEEKTLSIAPVTENLGEKEGDKTDEAVTECALSAEAVEAEKEEEAVKRRRFRAVKVPRFREKECNKEENRELGVCGEAEREESLCEGICEGICEAVCEGVEDIGCEGRTDRARCPKSHARSPFSGLFSSFCSDEMLVLALVVLLLLEGGDEILIFALLFVLT